MLFPCDSGIFRTSYFLFPLVEQPQFGLNEGGLVFLYDGFRLLYFFRGLEYFAAIEIFFVDLLYLKFGEDGLASEETGRLRDGLVFSFHRRGI